MKEMKYCIANFKKTYKYLGKEYTDEVKGALLRMHPNTEPLKNAKSFYSGKITDFEYKEITKEEYYKILEEYNKNYKK